MALTVITWAVAGNPEGWSDGEWLECDGSVIPADKDYDDLRAVLGKSTTPNYAELFLRGNGSQNHAKNNGSIIGVTNTNHTSGALGVVQGDGIREISGHIGHFIPYPTRGQSAVYRVRDSSYQFPHADHYDTEEMAFSAARVTPTSNEIRPVNTAVRYLIRAKH